jgi:hypothetical protein
MLALFAAALDTRIDAACVSGYFDDRRHVWQEPADRNVFVLLEQFGDAELSTLIAPRLLVVEAARGPELTLPGEGGAPGRLATPRIEDVRKDRKGASPALPRRANPGPPPLVPLSRRSLFAARLCGVRVALPPKASL